MRRRRGHQIFTTNQSVGRFRGSDKSAIRLKHGFKSVLAPSPTQPNLAIDRWRQMRISNFLRKIVERRLRLGASTIAVLYLDLAIPQFENA
jgi:hypothetical protein